MIVTLEMFDNADLAREPDRLREMFFERAQVWQDMPGLRMKTFFNNPGLGKFGAFVMWESARALDNFRDLEAPSALADRWGVEPVVHDFDLYQVVRPGEVCRY